MKNNQGVWTDPFSYSYKSDWYEMVRGDAQNRTRNFLRGVMEGYIKLDDGLSPQSYNTALDKWAATHQDMLAALVVDIQNHIASVLKYALPAHDERQICFKDVAEGLRFAEMEKPQGYKSTFIIPMMAHDIGRLLEGHFFSPDNPHDNWIPHSQLSFVLLDKILSKPDYREMPQELKFHFLYAVLAHSGDNGKSYMSRAVQTCDRMQLIGAEGFFRSLSYGVCLMDADIHYPTDESYERDLPSMFEHRSVFSMMEYCARNMRENIGEKHSAWQRRVAVENVALMMMACKDNHALSMRMFAPEQGRHNNFGPNKQVIKQDILEEADALFRAYRHSVHTKSSCYEVSQAIVEALESPIGAARLTDTMKKSVFAAVGRMSPVDRASLYHTICMAKVLRDEQDCIDYNVCQAMTDSPALFYQAVGNGAMRYGLEASQREAKVKDNPVLYLASELRPA